MAFETSKPASVTHLFQKCIVLPKHFHKLGSIPLKYLSPWGPFSFIPPQTLRNTSVINHRTCDQSHGFSLWLRYFSLDIFYFSAWEERWKSKGNKCGDHSISLLYGLDASTLVAYNIFRTQPGPSHEG